MILVDTSVWVDHFRRGNPRLGNLLEDGAALCHPFVSGELACGTLRDRATTLELFGALPVAAVATDVEALAFLEARRLMGRGLGYIDVHLLAAASLSGTRLWTLDKRLAEAARQLGLYS